MQIHYEFNERDLGHGSTETILHPVVLIALVVAIVLMLFCPRKYAVVPLLLCTFLVPRGQVIVVAGVHFYVTLILVLAGFIRVIAGKFRFAGGLNTIDGLFIAWALYRALAIVLTNWPDRTMEQVAFLVQAICGYFLFRYLLENVESLTSAARTFALIAGILGACMLYERTFLFNPFSILGGADAIPIIRNGTGRAAATFGHAILAGCFGATLIPLFAWLWHQKNRLWAAIGIAGSTTMVITTSSSTPLMAYAAGLVGLMLWPLRGSMRLIRWGIVLTTVLLAIAMKAPIWFLVARIDLVGGSGGYDRALLIDTCVQHFRDWWLIGTNQNGGWGIDMWDLSDQFVSEAELGGILTLIFFIAIISLCFRRVGKVRKLVEPDQGWIYWCLGSIMFAHLFAYLGVSYFDQNQLWWFAFLAMVSAVSVPQKFFQSTRAQEKQYAAPAFFPNYGSAARPWRRVDS